MASLKNMQKLIRYALFDAKNCRQFSSKTEIPPKLTLTNEQNGIRNVILNSPKNRNALSLEMMTELVKNLRRNKQDENLRCIVLSATGPVFSAGHNLKELSMEKGQPLHRGIWPYVHGILKDVTHFSSNLGWLVSKLIWSN